MSDVNVNTYDHLEQNPTAWHTNNTAEVNTPNFDYLPSPSLVTSGAQAGSMLMMASYSQHLAGGLIATDIPFPPTGCPGRKYLYAGFNVKQFIPPYPDGTIERNELDCKWTLPITGSNQANGSTEISQYGWRLDPTGKAWVSTGYFPTTYKVGQVNVFQIRLSTDGATVWSVTGLRCNSEAPFIPGAAFQNIPLIATTWTPGLHPQLQWEGGNEPFCATVYYERVQVVTSDAPIPFLDPSTF